MSPETDCWMMWSVGWGRTTEMDGLVRRGTEIFQHPATTAIGPTRPHRRTTAPTALVQIARCPRLPLSHPVPMSKT